MLERRKGGICPPRCWLSLGVRDMLPFTGFPVSYLMICLTASNRIQIVIMGIRAERDTPYLDQAAREYIVHCVVYIYMTWHGRYQSPSYTLCGREVIRTISYAPRLGYLNASTNVNFKAVHGPVDTLSRFSARMNVFWPQRRSSRRE